MAPLISYFTFPNVDLEDPHQVRLELVRFRISRSPEAADLDVADCEDPDAILVPLDIQKVIDKVRKNRMYRPEMLFVLEDLIPLQEMFKRAYVTPTSRGTSPRPTIDLTEDFSP